MTKTMLYIWLMIIPTKEQTFQAYVIEKKTTRQCADQFEMSQPWFRKFMKQYGIEPRSRLDYPGSNSGKTFSKIHRERISKSNKGSTSWLNPETGLHYNFKQQKIKCDFCRKLIYKKQCHVKNYGLHFCSNECHGKWKAENLIRENHPTFIERTKVNCAFCGKALERRKHEIERSKNFFCSVKCNGKWKAENLRGEKIYNWKGGYLPYYGENWLTQRRLAWERDNYTCQRCGKEKTTRNPDVHHIKPFRTFGLKNYKEANQLDNLVCLCNKCHKIVEENESEFLKLKS